MQSPFSLAVGNQETCIARLLKQAVSPAQQLLLYKQHKNGPTEEHRMTIANAKKFIDRGMADDQFRGELNGTDSISELYRTLNDSGLPFSPEEFEEAFRNRLVQCQFEEQADRLREFKMWWDLLHRFLGYIGEGPTGSCGSGIRCSSAGSCSGCGI